MRNHFTEETETHRTSTGVLQDINTTQTLKQRLGALTNVEHWLAAGFVRIPRTKADARLAFAARDCLQGLSCFMDVRERLTAGEKFPRIAGYIFNFATPAPSLKRSTVVKYVAVYHRYFIRIPGCDPCLGDEIAAEPALSEVMSRTFEVATQTGFLEIDFLQQLLQLQQCRIQILFDRKHELYQSEFIHREIREARETAVKLTEVKLSLGVYSATSGPRSSAISRQQLDELSPASKKALIRLREVLNQLKCKKETANTIMRISSHDLS